MTRFAGSPGRILLGSLFVLYAFANAPLVSASTVSDPFSSLGSPPVCVQSCIVVGFGKCQCTFGDLSCSCKCAAYLPSVETCIRDSCPRSEIQAGIALLSTACASATSTPAPPSPSSKATTPPSSSPSPTMMTTTTSADPPGSDPAATPAWPNPGPSRPWYTNGTAGTTQPANASFCYASGSGAASATFCMPAQFTGGAAAASVVWSAGAASWVALVVWMIFLA